MPEWTPLLQPSPADMLSMPPASWCAPTQSSATATLPKDKNSMWKTVAFLYQRCFAKQVKEEMQKHHKTCTPPAKGDAMECIAQSINFPVT